MEKSDIKNKLLKNPKAWLVTGVAGFIGSNLLETLLKLGQTVVGLDNYSTGHRHNLDDVKAQVPEDAWEKFTFIEGDIRNLEDCRKGCVNVDFVLHQAALGSVPRSIEDPIMSNQSNVDGIVNMLVASRDASVKRFIYASSSAIYGDHPGLPKVEDNIGRQLSPYGVTKYINELYANIFSDTYQMKCIGLRYFNVFGRRQDPEGAYAAVIPKWIAGLLNGDIPTINGDGETTRDFCYIDNVVQANLLAAMSDHPEAVNQTYNIACGSSTSLNTLHEVIKKSLVRFKPEIAELKPRYGDFRVGDVRHSQADISRAKQFLGYLPDFDVSKGLNEAIEWYVKTV